MSDRLKNPHGYLWHEIKLVTGAYHDTGGFLIITDRDPIQALAEFMEGAELSYGNTYDDWAAAVDLSDALWLGPMPSYNGEDHEQFFCFPDAGCC